MKAASTYLERIDQATAEDAKAYAASSEQFLFCVGFLEISAHDCRCDDLVEILEDHFKEMMEEVA